MAMSLEFPKVYEHNIIDINHARLITNKIMNDYEVSDLNITVTGEKLPAHKVILASFSEYFLTMFTCGLRETTEEYADLTQTDADTVKTILKYMYSGILEITEDTAESILKAAYFYQAHDVVYACSSFFVERLSFSNCIGIMITADMYNLTCLENPSLKFVNQHFLNLFNQEEFLSLNIDQLSKILSSDDIAVEVEDQIFTCITTWINFNETERKVHLLKLLKLVKLPLVSKAYLNNQLLEYCQSSRECVTYVKRITESQSRKREILRATPKYPFEKIVIVGDFGHENMHIRQYDPITNSWSKCMELDNRKRGFGMISLNDGGLVVFGGFANDEVDDVLDCIDMKTKAICQCNPLPVKCHGFAVATIGSGHGLEMFVVGGMYKNNFVKVLQKWRNGSNTWFSGPSLKIKRIDHGMAALGKKLYVVGGWTGTHTLQSVEMYDPISEDWTDCCPINEKRRAVGVATVGEYIYAVGGLGEEGQILSTVEKYDPKSDSWSFVKSMPRGRQGVKVVGIFETHMIVLGGYDKSPEVLKYSTETDEWEYLAPIEGAYADIGAVRMI
ncbi:kelch-like protein 12 [Arctopsyche grandis]|uniref:kelch-like protein 12 n=1 Tax=Arctopsyche grandis TaxID=121162 RepID=UPI00406D9983